jgi:hypothetical protein
MSGIIKNEDDFQAYLMEEHESNFGHRFTQFAKVDRIGGRTISPDIDLLNIDHDSKILTGYEFKFLNHKKDANYRAVRESLGQAIQYFQFGLDRSYIVLGIPDRKELTMSTIGSGTVNILTLIKALETAYNFNSLGIKFWFEDRDLLQTSQEPKGNFPVHISKDKQFESYRLDRECLFASRFHCDRKFLIRRTKRL